MHSKKHCWHTPVTHVVTLKWNIPLYSSKDWSRGATCTIKLLLNVSEDIAAKNQQLPVIRREATLIFKQHLMAFCYFWSGHDLPTAPWAKSNREAPFLQKTGSSSMFWACRISWTVQQWKCLRCHRAWFEPSLRALYDMIAFVVSLGYTNKMWSVNLSINTEKMHKNNIYKKHD